MLTGAERNSLALTLGFLLLGSGIKLWKRAKVEIGPFPTPQAAGASAGIAGIADLPAPAPAEVPGPADSAAQGAVAATDGDDAAIAGDAADTGDAVGPARTAGAARPREPSGRGYGVGESRVSAPKRKAPPAGKVDPNRATAGELATVPGIGPKIAAAIVAYRRERGPFRHLGQLREVKGIGAKKWAVIAPCLTVAEAQGGTPGDTAETGLETDGGKEIGGR